MKQNKLLAMSNIDFKNLTNKFSHRRRRGPMYFRFLAQTSENDTIYHRNIIG